MCKFYKWRYYMIETTNAFKIESLGIQECDVYDIDVENDHNFFGNDILVHNSNYINIQRLVDMLYEKKVYDNNKNLIIDILKFNDRVLQKIIDKTFSDAALYLNSYSNKMVMKVEKIIQKALFAAKKKYILRVLWNEGEFYEPYKDVIMGMAMKNVNYPPIVIEWLNESLKLIFDDDTNAIIDYIAEKRIEFENIPLTEISHQVKVNKYEKYIKEYSNYNEILDLYSVCDVNTLLKNEKLLIHGSYVVFSGATAIAKGAAYSNHLIKKHKLGVAKIMNGDAINMIYLKSGLNKMGVAAVATFPDNIELINLIKPFIIE